MSSDLADEVDVGLTSTMSISVNGARRNAVNWLVDGVMNVDVGSNITLLSTPTLESIEQFKIITSSYAAEWPRSGGGIINVVTKSGTSKYSGSGYEFFRSDKMNTNSFFRKQSTDPLIRDNAPQLKYNNFGFTVGGPLPNRRTSCSSSSRRKLRRITRAPASLTANVPNPDWLTNPSSANYVAPGERDPIAVQLLQACPAAECVAAAADAPGRYQVSSPNINNTRQEVLRMDYDMSNEQRLWGRYTHDLSETRELSGLFLGTPIPGVAGTDTNVPGQVAAVGLRSIIGSNKLNELTYHFSSNNITSQPADDVKNTRRTSASPSRRSSRRTPTAWSRSSALPVSIRSAPTSCSASSISITRSATTSPGSAATTPTSSAAWRPSSRRTRTPRARARATLPSWPRPAARPRSRTSSAATRGACTGCSYTEARDATSTMHLRFNRFEILCAGFVAADVAADASTTACATRCIRRSPTRTTCWSRSTRRSTSRRRRRLRQCDRHADRPPPAICWTASSRAASIRRMAMPSTSSRRTRAAARRLGLRPDG